MSPSKQPGQEEKSGRQQTQKQQKAEPQAEPGGAQKPGKAEISEEELIESTHWGEGSTGEDFGRS